LDRFLLDVSAEVRDQIADYELIAFPLGRWDETVALKMRCPSTSAVYIHTVPPRARTVGDALDWMFDCAGYLELVTQQT
jgi:hypothetical protein